MARKKKLINRTPYPDYVIETVARCLWPDIQAFFESEEGQRKGLGGSWYKFQYCYSLLLHEYSNIGLFYSDRSISKMCAYN